MPVVRFSVSMPKKAKVLMIRRFLVTVGILNMNIISLFMGLKNAAKIRKKSVNQL